MHVFTPTIFKNFPELTAGITLREASGQSRHDANFGYRSFKNVVDDDDYTAIKNAAMAQRAALGELLSPTASVHFVHQVHGAHVVAADHADMTGSIEADGIIITKPHQIAAVAIADCGGILLYDSQAKVAAAAHSGWRGTRASIVTVALQEMTAVGADVSRVFVYVSPTACAAHYPVGQEFRDFFAPEFLVQTDAQLGFDNAAAIRAQLMAAGVQKTHIEIDPTCTVEDNRLHSYRRDGALAGRFAAFIGFN